MGKSRADKSKTCLGDNHHALGLLDFVTQVDRQDNDDAAAATDLLAVLHVRINELDVKIAALQPAFEKRKPKRGKPLGRWFDEGRAYSVWLLAHTVWARQNGMGGAVDFRLAKRVTTRDLVALAKAIGWDNGPIVRGGRALFDASAKTIEESVSRGRKKLQIDDGWKSEACEGIFRKLSEYNANDKSS